MTTTGLKALLPGVSLVVGSVLYLLFWLGPVLDRDLSIAPSHRFQLVYYGVLIVTLIVGLWGGVRHEFRGRDAAVATAAVSLATLGLFAFVVAFAVGIGGLGLLAFSTLKRRLIGSSLVAGSVCWLLLWSTGARFDSEDSLPLTMMGMTLASVGLLLTSSGLVGWGWILIRDRSSSAASPQRSNHETDFMS